MWCKGCRPVFARSGWNVSCSKAVRTSFRAVPCGLQVWDRLNRVILLDRCTIRLYTYVSGWTNRFQFDWCSMTYRRDRATMLLLYCSFWSFDFSWYAIVSNVLTLEKPQRALKNWLTNYGLVCFRRKLGMPWAMLQIPINLSAACVAVVLNTGTVLVVFKYLSFMTMMSLFPVESLWQSAQYVHCDELECATRWSSLRWHRCQLCHRVIQHSVQLSIGLYTFLAILGQQYSWRSASYIRCWLVWP